MGLQTFALTLSLLIEAPVVWLILRRRLPAGREGQGRIWLAALAATLITHPLAWNANRLLVELAPFELRAAAIELTVILVEGLLFAGLLRAPRGAALASSAAANAASFLAGLWVLQPSHAWLWGWAAGMG
ncbi:MAG: hypothetical protein GMKNLPBB_00677 [Myxococcota bacterium]|nr:hypothetical protein [Myxococcota bacterium]